MSSPRNPANLADRLGLQPTEQQLAIMDRFAEDEDPLVLADEEGQHLVRAAALCVLWRMLLIPGSSVRVISSSRKLSSAFMGFLYDVTTTIDPALNAVCNWHGWRVMRIGSDDAYEMRLVSNKPKWLAEEPQTVTTFVILGAGSSEPQFCATRAAVDTHRNVEGVRTVTVW